MVHEIIRFNPINSPENNAIFIGQDDKTLQYIVQLRSKDGNTIAHYSQEALSAALEVASQLVNDTIRYEI